MKYYISFGNFQTVLQASNPYQACIRTLQRYVKQEDIETLPILFSVSQRGYGGHKDDLIVRVEFIIEMLQLIANNENKTGEEDGTGL